MHLGRGDGCRHRHTFEALLKFEWVGFARSGSDRRESLPGNERRSAVHIAEVWLVRNGGAPAFMRVAARRRVIDLRVPGRAPSHDGCSQSRAAIGFSRTSPCPATHSKFKRGTFEDAGVAAQIFDAQPPLLKLSRGAEVYLRQGLTEKGEDDTPVFRPGLRRSITAVRGRRQLAGQSRPPEAASMLMSLHKFRPRRLPRVAGSRSDPCLLQVPTDHIPRVKGERSNLPSPDRGFEH